MRQTAITSNCKCVNDTCIIIVIVIDMYISMYIM